LEKKINAFLCGGVFLGFGALGYFIYLGYKLRYRFFESLVRFCDNLGTEIGFSKKTIAQIIDTYIEGYSADFAEVLTQYRALIEARADITRESIILPAMLKKPEQEAVTDFFLSLGRHSSAEELGKIKNAKAAFEVFRSEASERLKRDASIYFKVCILVGIACVILLA